VPSAPPGAARFHPPPIRAAPGGIGARPSTAVSVANEERSGYAMLGEAAYTISSTSIRHGRRMEGIQSYIFINDYCRIFHQ